MTDTAPSASRYNAVHHVDGRTIPCCEKDETDCPCVCHDDAYEGGQT